MHIANETNHDTRVTPESFFRLLVAERQGIALMTSGRPSPSDMATAMIIAACIEGFDALTRKPNESPSKFLCSNNKTGDLADYILNDGGESGTFEIATNGLAEKFNFKKIKKDLRKTNTLEAIILEINADAIPAGLYSIKTAFYVATTTIRRKVIADSRARPFQSGDKSDIPEINSAMSEISAVRTASMNMKIDEGVREAMQRLYEKMLAFYDPTTTSSAVWTSLEKECSLADIAKIMLASPLV
jgi:hypothetical protein